MTLRVSRAQDEGDYYEEGDDEYFDYEDEDGDGDVLDDAFDDVFNDSYDRIDRVEPAKAGDHQSEVTLTMNIFHVQVEFLSFSKYQSVWREYLWQQLYLGQSLISSRLV